MTATRKGTRLGFENRGVAQLGSASALGAEGRRFKSGRPDQPNKIRALSDFTPPESREKADDHPQKAIEAFLLSRRVANCSVRTLQVYMDNLRRFQNATDCTSLGEVTPLVVQRYLTDLRGVMKPISVHQHFRTLRTFFRWALETGLVRENPMRGLTMKVPKTLPRVPDNEIVQRLFAACPDSFEGRRNKALVALLTDSGLRISEALRLRIEDVNFSTRTLTIRGGKGDKDGVGFFGAEAAHLLRSWLIIRQGAALEDFLFTDQQGRGLSRDYGTHILHRLSIRAGLSRKIGPHALRHYAATSILKQTGDLELVRQVLRHESLAMALRYAHIAKPEISRKFRRASPLDNLRAGR